MALSERPAERHRQVAGRFTDRVHGTRVLGRAPSPVGGSTARDVVRHLTEWFPDFLSSGAGIELPAVRQWTRTRSRHGRFTPTVCRLCWTIRRRRTGSSPTHTSVPCPWRRRSTIYTPDVFMHTWDLSRATGQDDRLDPDFCAELLGGMQQMEEVLPSFRSVRRPSRGTRRFGFPDPATSFAWPGPVLVGAVSRTWPDLP